MRYIIGLLAFLSLMVLWTAYAAILSAQEPAEPELPQIDGTDRELALALAQVTWNEASSYARPEDLYLIAQVTESHGATNLDRLAWLRAHSSCVLTDRALDAFERSHGNCAWTRELSWSTKQPAHWPPHIEWSRRARIWVRVLYHASEIVRRWNFPRPCEGRPTTWGSRVLDMHRALQRGLVPHRCTDTMGNVGFSRS